MKGIVVFLNGNRGLAVVDAICRAGHRVDLAVCPPTKADSLCESLVSLGVTPLPVADVNTEAFVNQLGGMAPQLLIVAGYSTILRRPLLSTPTHGAINLHGGRLPDYRGGSPLNWQIINSEDQIGISVIRLDQGIDTGDILAAGAFDLGPEDDIAGVHENANALFPELVLNVLTRFDSGDFGGKPQDPDRGHYWHQRNDADGRLHWDRMTALEVQNLVRAVTRPYPGAHCQIGSNNLRVYACATTTMTIRGVPGRVCYVQGQGPFVICRDKAVLLGDYQIEEDLGARLRHGTYLT
jgi:methionyl-tRNA formyltransferase